MHTLRTLCERVTPVPPEMTVEAACARFNADPTLRLLPVLSNAAVAGVLTRASVLSAAASSSRVAALIAAPPRIIEADEDVLVLSREMTGDMAGLDPFVVVDRGEYVGVGDGLTLLRGSVEAADTSRGLLVAARREIGIPLGGLLAVAGLMQRQPLSLDAAAQLRVIINAAESVLGSVADLAGCNGPGGAPQLAPETTAVRDLIDDIDALWQVHAGRRGMRLITSLRGDPDLHVSLDAGRFKQVLNAFVSEAFEAGSDGVVEVRLDVAREGAVARLEARVRDAGQSERASDAAGGFSEARRTALVAAMGGRIRRERNEGAGATVAFEVRVPVARSAEEIARSEAAAARRALGHILVVDDNATNRLVAEALCEGFGFTCEAVENGLEAVEAARLRAFDLILMDIKMPGMDGAAATLAIRKLAGGSAGAPIVALTANAEPDAVEVYRAAGMCGVVEKPIKPDALFAAITSALQGEPGRLVAAA